MEPFNGCRSRHRDKEWLNYCMAFTAEIACHQVERFIQLMRENLLPLCPRTARRRRSG
jgi:hypothetical protein